MAKKHFKKGQKREEKEFQEEVLKIDRVTRVVKGGRRLRFRCTVAIGDKKGRVGVGTGKATEVVSGIQKAVARAKANLVHVNIAEGDTIPHTVKVKHKAARMMIMPAAPGTGVKAGGSLRKVLALAGIKNVLSKNMGTRNPLVTAQCAIRALKQLRVPKNPKKKDATSGAAKQEKVQASDPKSQSTDKKDIKKAPKAENKKVDTPKKQENSEKEATPKKEEKNEA